jgi:NitT/TauT family transport system ATP-binding protein
MAPLNALEVRIDEKRYAGSDIPVHAGLAFALPERQCACIVGPSGCGKTTLLNMVSGLDTDYRGEIRLADGGSAPIGYMFQTPRLMPWLTVRENVRLALPADAPRPGPAERLLAEMEMERVLDAYPRALSGGMQRRVALARAFVAEPRLLLLDEPFLSLDAPAADRLRRLLLELWERRPTSILFVTHDLREALSLADRILFLSPRPARLLLDLPVTLPRPRDAEGPAIAALRRRLLDEHPDLLAGLLGENGEGRGDR